MPAILPEVLASEMGGAVGTLSPEKKWVRKKNGSHHSKKSASDGHTESASDQGYAGAAAGAAASLAAASPAAASPEHEHHHDIKKEKKKKKKKKKKKSRIPKGFSIVREGDNVYHNSTNDWFYDAASLHYYKTESGPFFVYDAVQKKLVPTLMN